MSSVKLWTDGKRVSADWNKSGPYTVFVASHTDAQGVTHGTTSTYGSAKAAVRAARRKSKDLS